MPLERKLDIAIDILTAVKESVRIPVSIKLGPYYSSLAHFAKRLDDTDLAIIDKRRPHANAAEVMNIIGDVAGRTCVLVDDMADTAGTLCSAAAALKKRGASRVVAYCTHAVLSGRAVDNIEGSQLDELVVSNTIPLDERAAACTRIRQLSIAELIAESIRRISHEESVGDLFMD